ncbi:MAG: PAS domain S-box protein [Deltaproteobacteria bacterium]|nr:PAS domain S-box protein [Deltaproteobacteria bacterium]
MTGASAHPPRQRALDIQTPLRVLVVEDRPADAELMMAELRRTGFDVDGTRVDTQADFVRELKARPDVVLADYSLPEFDAIRALGVLWESDVTAPLIVVTGQLGDEAAAECMKLGACDYVLKDRLARLGPAVEIALQQRRLELETRQAEAALKDSEERLKLVLEGSRNSFWDRDLRTGAVELSPQLALMLGYGETEQPRIASEWTDFVHPDDRSQAAATLQAHLEGKTPDYEAEYRLRCKSGTWLWVLDRGRVVARDDDGRPVRVAGTHRDITEAKAVRERLTESLQQLRALARRLQTVREEERAGIAREVHDVLRQEMTGLKMDVAWLSGRLAKAAGPDDIAPLLEKLEAMSGHIDLTIQNIRRISTELRPAVLDALGLVAALEWQARDFAKRTGVACAFVSELEDIDLDTERATAVFRIFQESLTNVTRHAKASQVTARVAVRPAAGSDQRQSSRMLAGILHLSVEDDGVGMPKSRTGAQRSLGLLGMQERAMIFGGHVTVEGEPGFGTTVSLTMPLG